MLTSILPGVLTTLAWCKLPIATTSKVPSLPPTAVTLSSKTIPHSSQESCVSCLTVSRTKNCVVFQAMWLMVTGM